MILNLLGDYTVIYFWNSVFYNYLYSKKLTLNLYIPIEEYCIKTMDT